MGLFVFECCVTCKIFGEWFGFLSGAELFQLFLNGLKVNFYGGLAQGEKI